MYEEYYGLVEKPFSLTPDPKYIYKSESHAGASDLLQYAVRRREGFVVVTGDIGTGKTTLCRALLEQIDRNTFTALVLNPFLSEGDLIKLILQDFGVVSREDIKSGRLANVSKQELIDTLYDFLLSLLPLHASAVLIIDEAQNLPLQVLEQIRILSNLETDKEKLLQIVLVGQMSLNTLLASPELRQLDQRVSIRYELQPLNREEVAAYISHRLSVAGGSAIMFDAKSVTQVHKISGGIPRLINLICDRSLLAAYSARTNRITSDIVQHAAKSLTIQPARERRRFGFFSPKWSIAAAAIGAVSLPIAIGAGVGPVAGLLTSPGAAVSPAAHVVSNTVAPPAGASALLSGSVAAKPEVSQPAVVARPASTEVALEPQAAYTVVVGSFPVNDDSREDSLSRLASLTERLSSMGYEVYHVDVDLGSRGWWRRVLIGSYDRLDAAQRAVTDLQNATNEFDDARAIRSSTIRATASAS